MRRFYAKCVLFVLICVLLLIPLNYMFSNKDGEYAYRMMKEMYGCEENIDVLFLGSSHVYMSYDTQFADELLGVKTYNAGSGAQKMNTSYYLLREISKYNNLKTVYLDTYYAIIQQNTDNLDAYNITDYMKFDTNKMNLLIKSGGMKTVINGYATFIRNLDNLNIIENIKSNFSDISDYSSVTTEKEEYRGEGFVYSNVTVDAEEESLFEKAGGYDFSGNAPLSELHYQSLMNIIQFCSENDIELVLVDQPMPKKTLDYVVGYDNYVRYIKKLAQDNGLKYWNFNLIKEDLGLDLSCFRDADHLNGAGAEIYTEFICNFINKMRDEGGDYEEYFYPSYQEGCGV